MSLSASLHESALLLLGFWFLVTMTLAGVAGASWPIWIDYAGESLRFATQSRFELYGLEAWNAEAKCSLNVLQALQHSRSSLTIGTALALSTHRTLIRQRKDCFLLQIKPLQSLLAPEKAHERTHGLLWAKNESSLAERRQSVGE